MFTEFCYSKGKVRNGFKKVFTKNKGIFAHFVYGTIALHIHTCKMATGQRAAIDKMGGADNS